MARNLVPRLAFLPGAASCSRYTSCRCCAHLAPKPVPLPTTTKSYPRRSLSSVSPPHDTHPHSRSGRHLALPPPLPYLPESLPFQRHLQILESSLISNDIDESWEVYDGLHESLRGEVSDEVLGRLVVKQAGRLAKENWERCKELMDVADQAGKGLCLQGLEKCLVLSDKFEPPSLEGPTLAIWEKIADVAQYWNRISPAAHLCWLRHAAALDATLENKLADSYSIASLEAIVIAGYTSRLSHLPIVRQILLPPSTSPALRATEEERLDVLIWLRDNGVEVDKEVWERVVRKKMGEEDGEGREMRKEVNGRVAELVMDAMQGKRFGRHQNDGQGVSRLFRRRYGNPIAEPTPPPPQTIKAPQTQSDQIRSLSLLLSSPYSPTYLQAFLASSDQILSLPETQTLAEAHLALILDLYSRIVVFGSSVGSEGKVQAAEAMAKVVERHASTLLHFGSGGWSGIVLETLEGVPGSGQLAEGMYGALRSAGLRWSESDLEAWEKVVTAALDQELPGWAEKMYEDAVEDGVKLGTRQLLPLIKASLEGATSVASTKLHTYLSQCRADQEEPGATSNVAVSEDLLEVLLVQCQCESLEGQTELWKVLKRVYGPLDVNVYSQAVVKLEEAADAGSGDPKPPAADALQTRATTRWGSLAYMLVVDALEAGLPVTLATRNSAISLLLFGKSVRSYSGDPEGQSEACYSQQLKQARMLYHMMLETGGAAGQPDAVTLSLFLEDYMRRGRWADAKRVRSEAGKVGMNAGMDSGVTRRYDKEMGRRKEARRVLRQAKDEADAVQVQG